eukprot:CAMPEP_0175804012 /NCGR_PEP_ID=MMETSP0097-20121207/88829_1 /TAXON_ID=311494 /ORGANISM="Alexandrium monilatum, Strain CCMP3105" /LENGTH=224 /DNA_ID=CAMNT_0017115351 /DNA_START=42 /DNA_END=713 /DNA_ORIENTATION=+
MSNNGDVEMIDCSRDGGTSETGILVEDCDASKATRPRGDQPGADGAGLCGGTQGDIRSFFGGAVAGAGGGRVHEDGTDGGYRGGAGASSAADMLGAFNLSVSPLQDVPEEALAEPAPAFGGSAGPQQPAPLETAVLSRPVALPNAEGAVPLLVAAAPLMPSGRAIWAQLPPDWLDVYGRSDALGTRCLFASRRHEHSVFEPVALDAAEAARLASAEPWLVQAHP